MTIIKKNPPSHSRLRFNKPTRENHILSRLCFRIKLTMTNIKKKKSYSLFLKINMRIRCVPLALAGDADQTRYRYGYRSFLLSTINKAQRLRMAMRNKGNF